jgi:hypothetical protein
LAAMFRAGQEQAQEGGRWVAASLVSFHFLSSCDNRKYHRTLSHGSWGTKWLLVKTIVLEFSLVLLIF